MEGGLSLCLVRVSSFTKRKEPTEAFAAGPAWQTSGDYFFSRLARNEQQIAFLGGSRHLIQRISECAEAL